MDFSKLKVAELKEELTKRGLSVKGLKAELLERLEVAEKGAESQTAPIADMEKSAESEALKVEPSVPVASSESPKKRSSTRRASIEAVSSGKLPKVEESESVTEAVIETIPEDSKNETVSEDSRIDNGHIDQHQHQPILEVPKNTENTYPVHLNAPETASPISASTDNSHLVAAAASSKIIHISHLTRPFSLLEFRELFVSFGEINNVWLDSLKTHSFVTFDSEASAQRCVEGLQGRQFPHQTGKKLLVESVSVEGMEMIKGESEKLQLTALGTTLMETHANSAETQTVPLEELFMRTEAEPSIYYLPKQSTK